MQVIGYTKAVDGTAIIDYDADPGKDYVGKMTIEGLRNSRRQEQMKFRL